MRSSLRPKPSEVVKPTVAALRSRRPIGATGVSTAPPAGVAYASAAVRSPPRIASSRSDHTAPSLPPSGGARVISARDGDARGRRGAAFAAPAWHERYAHAHLQRPVAVQRAHPGARHAELERRGGGPAQLARGALQVPARCGD